MRIYKKRPFSPPNSVKVNTWTQRFNRTSKRLSDLENLRAIISNGTMTEKLYDFINMDGSLDSLFPGLPRPKDGASCESLSLEQIGMIDHAIQANTEDLKMIFQNLWEAFKEWFLDWWDDCRRRRIEIDKLRSEFINSPNMFGDPQSFGAIQGHVYMHDDWTKMINACSNMFNILGSLPPDGTKLAEWVQSRYSSISNSLAVFGQVVERNPAPSINKKGVPGFDQSRVTFATAGWAFSQLPGDAQLTSNLLRRDENTRRLLGKMENIFKSTDPDDRYALEFVKDFVWCSMTDIFRVATALLKIFKMSASAARAKNATTQNLADI